MSDLRSWLTAHRDDVIETVPGLVQLVEDSIAAAAEYDGSLAGRPMYSEVRVSEVLVALGDFVMNGPAEVYYCVEGFGKVKAPRSWDVSPEEWRLHDV